MVIFHPFGQYGYAMLLAGGCMIFYEPIFTIRALIGMPISRFL